MVAQLITSFVAAATFGILFNVPRQSLLQCGFVGMVGWFIYVMLVGEGYDTVPASLVAAFFVAVIGQIFAKIYKMPVIIFYVSGIIPLVPGGLAFDAMRNFVENDYTLALQLAAKVFMISGGITLGLVFSEVVNLVFKRNDLKKEVR